MTHDRYNYLKSDDCSNSDEGGGAILDDLTLLSAGYALVLVFVTIVLGRFNMVQHKVSNCGFCALQLEVEFLG